MEKNEQQMPRLGEPVPAFEAMTTKGKISFPDDYKGKWVILFSHPADFPPHTEAYTQTAFSDRRTAFPDF